MKLSLITATYNSAATLKDCLESVAEQDYKDIEHLIIDGNSKDNTLALIEKFKINYPVLRVISEPDKGIYDALNKGIALATGDVVGFVHSDDYLADPGIVSRIMEGFKNKTIHGVYGDLHYVNKLNGDKVIRTWKSREFSNSLLQQGWMPAHPTLFLRKTVYQKHGDFDLSYKIAADYDFMLRILKDATLQFFYLPEVITKMRVGGNSNRSLKNILQKSKEDYKALNANGIRSPLWALFAKNVSKIPQFF